MFGIILIKMFKRILSLLKLIIWKILYGSRIDIEFSTIFYSNTKLVVDGAGKLFIGKNCFFNNGCSINSLCEISIGDYCIFGENVKIYDHNHKCDRTQKIPFKKQGYEMKKIKIGNNCWIGSNVTILAGVVIGDNVIVGANTVVTKSIEKNKTIVSKVEYKELEAKCYGKSKVN